MKMPVFKGSMRAGTLVTSQNSAGATLWRFCVCTMAVHMHAAWVTLCT